MIAAITNPGVYVLVAIVACAIAAVAWVAWAERNDRLPMTEHTRIPNDPTRSNR
jgi:hypothetical protein